MRLIIDIETEKQYRLLQEICFKNGVGWGWLQSMQYNCFHIGPGSIRVGIYLPSRRNSTKAMFLSLLEPDLPDDIHISPERIAYEITN